MCSVSLIRRDGVVGVLLLLLSLLVMHPGK